MHTTDFREYSLTFIFYLIIVHAISGILNKIMYISESFTQIDGSVERMDEILRIPTLPEKSTAATLKTMGLLFRMSAFPTKPIPRSRPCLMFPSLRSKAR